MEKKKAEAQKREKTQISLSSDDWEIVKEEDVIWVNDVYLTPCTCALVNVKYNRRRHLFDDQTTLKILSVHHLWSLSDSIS